MAGTVSRVRTVALLGLLLGGSLGVDNCQGGGLNAVRAINLRPGVNPPACGASLRWERGVAPAGGILRFDVYRNGRKIGDTPLQEFVDGAFLVAGSVYAYTLRTVGNDQVAYPPTPPLAYLPPNCPPIPDASLQVQVFQVGFTDFPVPQDAAAVESLMFGSEESVATYWDEVSYRRQELTGSTLAVRLPGTISSYCSSQVEPGIWTACATARIKEDLVTAVTGQVNFWDIERAALIVYGYRWRGSAGSLTTYAGPVADVIIGGEGGIDRYDISTIAHEMGHNAGAGHASTIACPGGGFPPDLFDLTSGGCSVRKYTDSWDPMGVGSAVDDPPIGPSRRQHFGVYHKEQLGFLRAEEIGVLRLADLAVGESRRISLRYHDPISPVVDDFIALCLQALPGPLVWKLILTDPVHLSLEGRQDDELQPPFGIVRLGTSRRSDALDDRGDTFLADPPWLLRLEGDTFEDARAGVRVTYEDRSGAGSFCSVGEFRVERIATSP